MTVKERCYLRADSGDHSNYYRITFRAHTMFSDAQFRQGWFPAQAVDALFGDVSEEGSAEALTTREELRRQIDTKLIAAQKAYLDAVTTPDCDPDELAKRREALLNVRLVKVSDPNLAKHVTTMEYNPMADLVTYRHGQKLVVLLSSNPDQVISKLAVIAEDARTEQLFNKYANVIEAKERVERSQRFADIEQRLTDVAGVADYLTGLAESLDPEDPGDTLNRGAVLGRLDAAISRIEAMDQVGLQR
jgi:hypothetical protein